jgi:DNA-binding response OmpR family regulator
MLTAKTQEKDILTGMMHGADMYLTKPFKPNELLMFVQRILAAHNGDDGSTYKI